MAMANTDPGTARSTESRVLRRSRTDRVIGGVCGGLGAYFGLDPALFRIAFVILVLAGGGAGLPIYLVAWIITPGGESTPPGPESPSRNPASLVVGTIFVAMGLGLLAEMMFPWFDRMLWPVLLVGLGVFVITGTRREGSK
jgi:phage shock protein C